MKTFSLHPMEKLKHRKIIESLFQNGKAIFVFPFKIVFNTTAHNGLFPLKFMVSVPKRNFKKAVDRNLLRRRTKESFRIQKHHLTDFLIEKKFTCDLIFIYQGKEKLTYEEINSSIFKAIEKLKLQIDKTF